MLFIGQLTIFIFIILIQINWGKGSTPLDLFKFYVEDLKARYHEDKKLIKEILKDSKFQIQIMTTFENFVEIISNDKRANKLDAGNLKITFTNLLEKAELKERERVKEEQRKHKKLESNFKSLIKKLDCDQNSKYADFKEKLEKDEAFKVLKSEMDAERVFNEYINELQETCLHHIKRKKEKKRKKRSRTKSNSKSKSPSPIKMPTPKKAPSDEDDQAVNSAQMSKPYDPNKSENEGEIHTEDEIDVVMKPDNSPVKSSKKHKKTKKRKKKSVSKMINNKGHVDFSIWLDQYSMYSF